MTYGLHYLLTYLNALNTDCKYIVSIDITLFTKKNELTQYVSRRRTFQLQFPTLIKRDYTELECRSSASVNNSHAIYNQNQEPKPIGNFR